MVGPCPSTLRLGELEVRSSQLDKRRLNRTISQSVDLPTVNDCNYKNNYYIGTIIATATHHPAITLIPMSLDTPTRAPLPLWDVSNVSIPLTSNGKIKRWSLSPPWTVALVATLRLIIIPSSTVLEHTSPY